ncbi:MAG: polysaccharide biosynthesis protein [Betaproteobacteria bacterium]|jgi:O-antigen/teichoic acid export membrane protein|nr:polysaccharide biosynthesis protein [Betaproteobacteria bacterium]
MRDGFVRATLTLLAGGALAQAIPLALGPWLSRLYSPESWGTFATFMAIATNVAVVACGRFEMALPLARDEAQAKGLMALSVRLMLMVAAAAFVLGLFLAQTPLADQALVLPLAVVALASASCLTLWATRAQRFRSLAVGRLVQYGGAAVVQVVLGLAGVGVMGLVAGPIVAAALACVWLCVPPPSGGWASVWQVPWAQCQRLAREYKEFPLFNTPHAFAGALQDTLTVALLMAWSGDAAAGFWGLAIRYLKAPATLIGSAVSQVLYPQLAHATPDQAQRAVRRTMAALAGLAAPLVLGLMWVGPELFAWAFGERWREAGRLAVALAPYIGMHFIASPLAVVTLAGEAQAWALKVAVVGQAVFLSALAVGLWWGGLIAAGWCVSAAMVVYFGLYFRALSQWTRWPERRWTPTEPSRLID